MKLSKNFRLDEFLVSETAERRGIDMTPNSAVIENIRRLVEDCMQPIRDHLDRPIFITSGYRPLELNNAIGGSRTSAHMSGSAADFVVSGMSPYEVCKEIETLSLPYDQLIHEFGRWIHLGISAQTPRMELLTAYRDGRTKYTYGIHKIEDLV